MFSQGFAKVATNCDILIQIYQFLNFEDKLRLARVSLPLARIFENFIWKENYRILTVDTCNGEDYIVTNGTDEHALLLTRPAFQEFLLYYADQVHELTLLLGLVIDLKQFKSLNKLTFTCYDRPLDDLQQIVSDAPELTMLKIYLVEKHMTIGETLSKTALLQMKNLKQLSLYGNRAPFWNMEKYCNFIEIITELKLEYLELESPIEPEMSEPQAMQATRPLQLKKLNINTTFDANEWQYSYNSLLNNFENLLSLTVCIWDEVHDELLAIIAKACKNLRKLKIHDTTFRDLKTPTIPATVVELHLIDCYGLTFANLKYFLTATRMNKFVSYLTHYKGVFQEIQISPSIETLHSDICNLQLNAAGNLNLKDLSWYHSSDCMFQQDCCTGVCLASCVNLENLNLDSVKSQPDFHKLLQLKRLTRLSLSFEVEPILWIHISALLRHATLEELIIRNCCNLENPIINFKLPNQGFVTTIRNLELCYDIFAFAMDFWLDLLRCNSTMKLVIVDFPCEELKLVQLINNEKFPKSLKRIGVFGFTIDCFDLRRNFSGTAQKLFGEIYNLLNRRIVLCRN